MKKLSILLIFFLLISCSKNDQPKVSSIEKMKCPFTGRITATSLLIRSKPDKKAKILGRVPDGHRIEVISRSDIKETISGRASYWYEVKSLSGIKGYSFGGFIEKVEVMDQIPYEITEKCPDSVKGFYECKRYKEKKKLAPVRSKVKREKHKLTLFCDSGKTVTFTDRDMDDSSVQVFSFKKYYKDEGQFLVGVAYYEGSSLYLVNEKTSKKITIWGTPVFSPDKKRFICVSLDMEAGYNPNGIQVWEKKGDSFIKKYQKELEWGPANPKWVDSNTIKMTRYDRTKEGYKFMSSQADLTFNKKRWVLK